MKNKLIFLLFAFSANLSAINVELLTSIEYVESRGNVRAIGDSGKAFGCLQIWNVVIQDVNRIAKTNYVHKDAFNRKRAFAIAGIYLTYWGKVYKRKTGKKPTTEVYARIWNGGPSGWKKKSTIKYWRKVEYEMRINK